MIAWSVSSFPHVHKESDTKARVLVFVFFVSAQYMRVGVRARMAMIHRVGRKGRTTYASGSIGSKGWREERVKGLSHEIRCCGGGGCCAFLLVD